MKLLRGTLALTLSYALGVQPCVAAVVKVQVAGPSATAGASAAAGAVAAPSLSQLKLSPPSLSPSAILSPSLAPAPALSLPALSAPRASIPALSAPTLKASPAAAPAAVPAQAAAFADAPFAAPAAQASLKVAEIQTAVEAAGKGLERASGAEASAQAGVQFSKLTGEKLRSGSGSDFAPPQAKESSAAPLAKGDGVSGRERKAEPPQPGKKGGVFRVFKDPARNGAFWRYVSGYSIFLFGFQMYVVGLPYLISSITKNALVESGDSRAGSAEAVKELVRSNRSLARIAHWGAQAFSYIAIPLFTQNAGEAGPKKWLVRSMLIRAGVLALVPALFFATGLVGLQGAIFTLVGLIALQSFFQGLTVTSEGAATTRLLGDKSVTPEERTKANSILTVLGSVIAIIGPLVAGQIAGIGPIMGKSGVGGAVIYGIYAATVGIAGLIYAGIKLFGGKGSTEAKPGESTAAPAPKKTLGSTIKGLWTSIKDGTKIIFKDRLLRTMLLISMIGSLFSDPLVFNVLPEYIEGLVASNGGSLGPIMSIPGVGWFLKSLAATPMGNFALMMLMASVGSIVATLLMKPLTKLFTKLGFKTEEAQTVPFYFIAALEAPLFLLMINTPTILGAIGLYALQSLAVGFIGIAISGLYQKNLGARKDGDIPKILAANSLIGIAAAIVSTFAYGFLLKDIAIGTSLLIAAIATGVVGLLRLAAPFLMFSKSQRRPPEQPAFPEENEPVPPKHALPPSGDHHGVHSVQSTHN